MGVFIAIIIFSFWLLNLGYSLLYVTVDLYSFSFYFHFLLQIFLYTGLFITGHDAMHDSVSPNPMINKISGYLACFLFAGMSYSKLINNHRKHHAFAGTRNDPDYSEGNQNIVVWFMRFMFRYVSITQIIIMAVLFNLLKFITSETSIWIFWAAPAVLASFQLFYFGTYIPHRLPHTEKMFPYNSRTQKKNFILAFFSCYFFGYHYEHHYSPQTPWWNLYKIKNVLLKEGKV